MSNLVDYAKEELKRIGMLDSGEPYNDITGKAILDLIELFASQGHSGFSAPYTVRVFERLAMFKPLKPLTGEDDEWIELSDGSYQNKRYSAVFKEKDGKAYNIEGKKFTDDGGKIWYTSKDSRVEITFPYTVPDEPEQVYLTKGGIMSKEEAIKIFNTLLLFEKADCTKEELKELCRIAIESIEQTMWIPVSERLPDNNDDVLYTDKDGLIGMGWYGDDFHGWRDYIGEDYHAPKDHIKAWMPLPEPYYEKEKML